jgi:hypothetical protein
MARTGSVQSGERLIRALLALLLLALASPELAAAAPSSYAAVLPAYQDALEHRFGDQLLTYDIDIRFRPEENRITGSMTVELVIPPANRSKKSPSGSTQTRFTTARGIWRSPAP